MYLYVFVSICIACRGSENLNRKPFDKSNSCRKALHTIDFYHGNICPLTCMQRLTAAVPNLQASYISVLEICFVEDAAMLLNTL